MVEGVRKWLAVVLVAMMVVPVLGLSGFAERSRASGRAIHVDFKDRYMATNISLYVYQDSESTFNDVVTFNNKIYLAATQYEKPLGKVLEYDPMMGLSDGVNHREILNMSEGIVAIGIAGGVLWISSPSSLFTWDGLSMTNVTAGSPFGGTNHVTSLVDFNGSIFFGTSIGRIYEYNGAYTQVHTVYSNNIVSDLRVWNGSLYGGCLGTTIFSNDAPVVWSKDGKNWNDRNMGFVAANGLCPAGKYLYMTPINSAGGPSSTVLRTSDGMNWATVAGVNDLRKRPMGSLYFDGTFYEFYEWNWGVQYIDAIDDDGSHSLITINEAPRIIGGAVVLGDVVYVTRGSKPAVGNADDGALYRIGPVQPVIPSRTYARMKLSANSPLYEPGDEVILNASVSEERWVWGQVADGPGARYAHAAVWDDLNGQMLVFGGNVGGTSYVNELYAYLPASNTWTKKASGATARHSPSVVWDSGSAKMIVFGGWEAFARLNDTWIYDPSSDTWMRVASGPAPRYSASAVWDDRDDQMIVFGGNGGVMMNDTWIYRPSTDTWVEKARCPVSRGYHVAVWDGVNGQMLVYGGTDDLDERNDTWAYSPASDTWSRKADGPSPRSMLTAAWDSRGGRMIVFGGHEYGQSKMYNDTWAYYPSKDLWIQLETDVGPTPRYHHVAVWDEQENQMIVYGGHDGTAMNDAWHIRVEFLGTIVQQGWEQKASGPRARNAHAAAWDSTNDRMVIFGGEIATSPTGDLGDTWIHDPINDSWSMRASGPANRSGVRAVYDSANKAILMFGGYSQATQTFLNDLWAYYPSNDTWVQKSGGPPGRRFHVAAWDPSTGTMYIFGGEGPVGGNHLDDLWAYHSSSDSWVQKSSRSKVGTSSAATWDVLDGRMLVFGGGDGNTYLSNDLWAYYPFNDTWDTLGKGATMRAGSTIVWDERECRALLFGGSQANYLNDLWAIHPSNSTWYQLDGGPLGRGEHSAVWDDDHGMTIFGGSVDGMGRSNDTWTYRTLEQFDAHLVSFQVNDPFNQPYFIMTTKTSATGNASVSFTLSMDAPEGIYRCSATANISGDVLFDATTFEVRWPWMPVLDLSPIIPRPFYLPGEMIALSAYTGHEHAPANASKPASGVNLTASLLDPSGIQIDSFTRPTNESGVANLSFNLPAISVKGIYSVLIGGFENLTCTTQFNARLSPPPGRIRFREVTVPANATRGDTFVIRVVIENSMSSNMSCLLVVQVQDINNVPLRPQLKTLDVAVSAGFLATMTLSIDPRFPAGTYSVQVQLLTGLPRDRGHALDFRDGTIDVN